MVVGATNASGSWPKSRQVLVSIKIFRYLPDVGELGTVSYLEAELSDSLAVRAGLGRSRGGSELDVVNTEVIESLGTGRRSVVRRRAVKKCRVHLDLGFYNSIPQSVSVLLEKIWQCRV